VWRGIAARGPVPDAAKIWLDGMSRPALDVSVPRIGAPAAWQAGYDGTGVTVAVVDSGIDADHPDLAGKVVAARDFTGEEGRDIVGHGTHVASTIAGSGAASGGRNRGVAPGARLVDAKVCIVFGCLDSWIIDGMYWAVAEQHAKVVNVSLGRADTPEVDPLEQAVADLTARYGALFVISAGNSGADRTVSSPGSADAALTVGAIDDTDALAPFSSRGPRAGDSALKPDITAPGVDIDAALSEDAGGDADQRYVSNSGTSMAAPHVAGTAAILAQRRPDLGAPELKASLMGSAVPHPGTGIFAQGAGRVDVPGALAAAVTTTPPSVSFGLQIWPHGDDTPVTRSVTYHNAGTAEATLDLALAATGPDGNPAPAGMFTLSTTRLTVPAGGTAGVNVTADTSVVGPDGFAGGYLVATGGGTVTRTPFAVEKEVESYDLTVAHIGRSGGTPLDFLTRLINVDTGEAYAPWHPSGTVTARVPKGRYLVDTAIFDGDIEDPASIRVSQLLQPSVDLDHAQRVTLDARTAKPLSAKLPKADARQVIGAVHTSLRIGDSGSYAWGMVADTFDSLFVAPVGDDSSDAVLMKASGQWARGRADGTVDDSPYVYNLAWTQAGRAFDGLRRTVREKDLATVNAKYLSHLPGGTGLAFTWGKADGLPFGSAAPMVLHPPFHRVEYYQGAENLFWDHEFAELSRDDPSAVRSATRAVGLTYRAGRTYAETWNRAPFGPASPAPDPRDPGYAAARQDNTMFINALLFGSAGEHRVGFSTGTGRVTLFRDGTRLSEVELGELMMVTVPPGPGRYRLAATGDRGAPFTLSTSVSATWEFDSRRMADGAVVPLPLLAVRFSPRLDDSNAAPAGRTFTVPVAVQAPAPGAQTRLSTVEVSYDDGRTWQRVTPRPVGGGGLELVLHHPKTPGFVSFRATASDAAGNTVEQSIIRAYRTV
jgi:subtilisin family serine protease